MISQNNEFTLDVSCDITENEFFKIVAQKLTDESLFRIGESVDVFLDDSKVVRYALTARGTFKEKGVVYPSLFIKEISFCGGCYKRCDDFSQYDERYLTCIHPESNNYKFYRLMPCAKGIDVEYGRIGSEKGEFFGAKKINEPYPTRMFWIRYYEKLSKGYVDNSEVYLSTKASTKKAKKTNVSDLDSFAQNLYNTLLSMARQTVRESLVNEDVTIGQYKKAKKIFTDLLARKTVNGFNRQLILLMQIMPRKVDKVNSMLAKNKDDFKRIIDREESLLNAIYAVIESDLSNELEAKTKSSFEKQGIEIYIANEKQRNQVLNSLSDDLKDKVKQIYRVIPKKQLKSFNFYLKNNDIHLVKQFWHGSKNENWLSIILNGLSLTPKADITGKMFGNGIYFAPSSRKSWNYTSYHGSYWAKGTSDKAFMGLYATAYGTPKTVTSPCKYNQRILQKEKKNCVHALKGNYLFNDEIIFYDESAMVLNYLVEFG